MRMVRYVDGPVMAEGDHHSHHHRYQATRPLAGSWYWCVLCECWADSACYHPGYTICIERADCVRGAKEAS